MKKMQMMQIKNSKNEKIIKLMKSYWILYLFILPAIAVRILFSYLPMFGNVIAFLDYNMFEGWMGLASPFIGLDNFKFIFTDPVSYNTIIRTFIYSSAILVTGFAPPIILALLINELRNVTYKKVIQTISYVPHFASWVSIAGLIYIFLSVDTSGILNSVKVAIFGGERIAFLQNEGYFLPILLISGIWKDIGWSSILYLAAITGIDQQLYEAAWADGAGRWKQMWHVTLPSILPAIIVLLIFSLGRLFSSNFDQVFNLQNPTIQGSTYTIDVYSYYKGIVDRRYSISAALGLFQGFLTFLLTMGANYISKKADQASII